MDRVALMAYFQLFLQCSKKRFPASIARTAHDASSATKAISQSRLALWDFQHRHHTPVHTSTTKFPEEQVSIHHHYARRAHKVSKSPKSVFFHMNSTRDDAKPEPVE